jgi:hypothetical protein
VLIDEKIAGTAAPRRNHTGVHDDFLIGSGDLLVTGITCDGDEVPIMSGGAGQLCETSVSEFEAARRSSRRRWRGRRL